MPPKQQPEEVNSGYKPYFVLPIVLDSENAQQCLRKNVNIKKNIDNNKIIEVLKEKGLQPFLNEKEISEAGRKFVCENFKIVCQEAIANANKPVDPKKDAKKDKKQAKKEQPVEEAEQPMEIPFQKDCSDFYFLLDFPENSSQLEQIVKLNVQIDIVVVIEPKIQPGSRIPDYSLLKNEKSTDDLSHTLKQTIAEIVQDGKEMREKKKQIKKQILQKFKELKIANTGTIKQNTIIIEVPFMNNLSKPEENSENFLNSLYGKLCKITLHKKGYEKWKGEKKTFPMIQPMKQVIKKEVQVDKNEDKGKKGGKASEPVFETVEEVVQTRYESLPENIKSDLKDYSKMKNNIQKTSKKHSSIYNKIIDSCLQMFSCDTEINTTEIAQNIHNIFEKRPLNKVTQENLVNKVREISYPKQETLKYQLKFNFQTIQSDISFLQLSHKADGNVQSLKIEYIVEKMQIMIKKTLPKIKWDFGDRQNIERFSAARINAIINEELLKDPEIITGFLESEGIKLLVLTRTNPPGRVLYHNNFMNWKVIPDFQNWVDNFCEDKEMLEKDNFYDYDCSACGNLAIKSKSMMPTDNTIIKDEIYTIGNKRDNLIQFYQQNCVFGMKKKNNNHIYWHKFENNVQLKAFKCFEKAIKKTERRKQIEKIEKQEQEGEKKEYKQQNEIQIVQQEIEVERTELCVGYKDKYSVIFSPYPTIIWNENPFEKKRQFGSKGEITIFKKDGSIDIYYPDGSVSQFRNGKWIRICGNQIIESDRKGTISYQEIIQGETTIRIRQDQTIFIEQKNNIKRIIFPDSTELYENQKTKKREIKNPSGPLIRISLPRDVDFNVIGYGSAFAYLGFQNILQRSYDGYLYEFIDYEFSSHHYIEKFELNEQIYQQQVRLLSFKDGSQIKVLGQSGKIVYISPCKTDLITQQYLNQRWLQLFTTPDNFGEGVYDIDIKSGCINTFDKESNRFNTKVGNPSEVNIAVSFSIDESQKESQIFPNGFHVPNQNYFLPPPNNSIPPRLFSIHPDGSGIQYLSSAQIGSFHSFHAEEEYQGERTVRQYSRKKQHNNYFMNLTFTEDVNTKKFGLPQRLKSRKTVMNLVPNHFDALEHRVIEQINWNSDFSRVKKLENQIRNEIDEKKKKIGKLR